jgi:hypothetical protein
MGDLARDLGETGRVRELCEECLTRFRDLGHRWGIGFSLNNMALAACLDGDLVLAATHADESAAIFWGIQAEPSLAEVLVTLGRVRGARGEEEAARASLAEALTLAWEKGPPVVVAAALEVLGMQAVRQKHEQHGVQLLAAAAALRQAIGAPARSADRSAIEGALAAGRAALGDAAHAEAWSAGETVPLEQIVAHVGDDA